MRDFCLFSFPLERLCEEEKKKRLSFSPLLLLVISGKKKQLSREERRAEEEGGRRKRREKSSSFGNGAVEKLGPPTKSWTGLVLLHHKGCVCVSRM